MAEQPVLFMGIDGGGSRCRARLRDADGSLLGSAHGGGANVYLDFDGALAAIATCVDDAIADAGLPGNIKPRVHLGLGLAGVSSPKVARQVETALEGFGRVRAASDTVTACLGAHGGHDGGLIVAGTGSAALALVDGREIAVGGRGFLLGDDGSGARIGLDAWRRALRAHDGLEEHTPFTRRLMAQFKDDPAAVIRWGLKARSSDFGAYAPTVFSAAATGDAAALGIVRRAADAYAELGAALRRHGVETIAMVGGGAEAIRPYLPPALVAALKPARYDALDGAILLVGGPAPSFGLKRPSPSA